MPKKKKQPKQKSDVKQPTQPTQVQLAANNQFCSVLHTSFFKTKIFWFWKECHDS